MAHRTVHRLACLVTILAVTSSAKKDQTRWSRQISTYTSDISDWVPLPGPVEREPAQLPQIKRQAVAEPRILTEPFPGLTRPTGFSQDAFPSRNYYNTPANRQLYLQSVPAVPSAPQNYLTDQGFGQGIRFGLSQPNFPLNQGFVAPPFGFDNIQPQKPRQPAIINPVSFSQGLPGASQAKPFLSQGQKTKLEVPRLVDGYRAENSSGDYSFGSKKPQSLQKIKFDTIDKPIKSDTLLKNSKNEREEVQLLYVPLESLNRGQFNFRSPLTNSQLVNMELFSQGASRPNSLKQTFISDYQRPAANPLDTLSGQNYFSEFNTQLKDDQVPKYSTIPTPFPTQPPTTPKPKKLKPHQPPLAIFMTKEVSKNNQVKVGDVLSSLKNAETIAVLDSVNPLNAPKVFIGPSTLPPPENFVKFELPYLSNIENSDKKLKQLPFFVAPLSYNTPNGFAKIPFPSPHVGSVVINSQIRETPQVQTPSQPSVNPNYYSVTPTYKTEKPVTQKPTFSYYSTASPKVNPVPNYQSNYYSFEPQTVSSIKPPKQPESATAPPKSGSYFLSNVNQQYSSQEYFQPQNNYKSSELIDQYKYHKQDPTTTVRTTTTTTTTTTRPPSTYPSQLLETHNPYSINQAFHFSTPLDYHNYFDDIKQPYATPDSAEHIATPSATPSPPQPSTPVHRPSSAEIQPEQIITEKPKYRQQTPPNYLQNYTPEIHHDSDQNLKYPVFNPTDYIAKTELTSQQSQPSNPVNTDNTPAVNYNQDVTAQVNNNYHTDSSAPAQHHQHHYSTDVNSQVDTYRTEYNHFNSNQNLETQPPVEQPSDHSAEINNIPTVSEIDSQPKYENDAYNAYQANIDYSEVNPTSSSTTTTTTTRRTPQRNRGRPRYTTTPRSDSYESTTKVVVTRRPLRERRPLPPRSRYEPNKITTEKPSRKPLDSGESTTKSSRTRTRGRIHYKPSENDDVYDRRIKSHNSKEEDLAYQRDVLHQNYPVTLMERMSTVDIEAITEPTPKQSSEKVQEPITETSDTENAYTNEKASITQHYADTESKEESPLPTYTSRSTAQTETSYVPNLPSTRQEYFYQSRSSIAPVESSAFDETAADKEDDIYVKQTTPVSKSEYADVSSYTTETPASPAVEQSLSYSVNNEFATVRQEEVTTSPEPVDTKLASQENHETEEDEQEQENVVQTTPSYNRVRVRPGVIRQYHQASTESSKPKDRKRPSQPVTYRPAFDRRRTTMRIDEIEADLKTKQVHARPEVQEVRHPVYRPEPTTEPTITSTTDSTTKRGHFRRRRPTYSYTTTSTESANTKRVYEAKNRFRGRRPTEKPSEKSDVSTEAPVSTTRSSLHSRYSNRPRLSERFNKKPEIEESEDQDSNFSINRPKYAEPETDQWSPKISSDSFKPYNPNDIIDEQKVATTERRSDKESELDIITARNEYEDILLTVTPASNNRMNKKIPEIPPTLEALVEQSKVTRSDSADAMSTFESMLEEVMKSLEEQDQDEYTVNVMKHKGGEIGEIPPERIISSGDNYVQKQTTTPVDKTTTEETTADDSTHITEDDKDRKGRRRGFWKKVKVRPATTESIEFAESQYYTNTVNRLGQPLKLSKNNYEKAEKTEKPKVTTYKPSYNIIKDLFSSYDDSTNVDIVPTVDIPKISSKAPENDETLITEGSKQTTVYVEKEPEEKETQTEGAFSPGELDLGTGSPDPTIDDLYLTTPMELTTTSKPVTVNKSDAGFSFMDYLFGTTSEDIIKEPENEKERKTTEAEIQITTEQPKPKIVTTESAFIPEEITAASVSDENTETTQFTDIKKLNTTVESKTEKSDDTTEISVVKVETSSVSSFMNPANVVSTSMSTEVSHETEICFRGKCIKTSKDIL